MRKHMKALTAIIAAIGCAAFAPAASAATTSPAVQAAHRATVRQADNWWQSPCTGSTCVGKDPQALGCGGSNGSNLASVTAPGGGATVTLRWSSWCTANWANINVSDWGDDWFVETADGNVERYSGDGTWTFMVDGTQLARACVQGYGYANYACTAWY